MRAASLTKIERLCELPTNNSFFLFGARGTGKTTLLRQLLLLEGSLHIDLLDDDTEEKLSLRPQLLLEQVRALKNPGWVVIDEIQKVPKLLDLVHILIEEKRATFALTGSSSCKLKRGGADLFAGRASRFFLFPLTARERGPRFDLQEALRWGNAA